MQQFYTRPMHIPHTALSWYMCRHRSTAENEGKAAWHRSWPCGQSLSGANLSSTSPNNIFHAPAPLDQQSRNTGVDGGGARPVGRRGHAAVRRALTADWPPGPLTTTRGHFDRAWNWFTAQKTDFNDVRPTAESASSGVRLVQAPPTVNSSHSTRTTVSGSHSPSNCCATINMVHKDLQ